MGFLLHSRKYNIFDLWKPGLWTSFCIMGDSLAKYYKVFLNNKLIYDELSYDGAHRKETGNIFLLNGFSPSRNRFIYPFQGEVTDVNIWNKTLTDDDVKKFSNCHSGSGNLVSWDKARINLNSVEVIKFNEADICKIKDQRKFISFAPKMNFNESVKFCQKLGGKIAVADNSENLNMMVEAFHQIDCKSLCFYNIYSGYWNSGGWKNANNGEKLDWNNWSNGTININAYYNSCATIDIKSLQFNRNTCKVPMYPICFFEDGLREMQLRGMDIDNTREIDSQFYLVNSTHMIGKTRSFIFLQNNSWHIRTGNKSVFTFGNKKLPLGINDWTGAEGNVKLILHKKMEQPGNFCCDDGETILSKFVCDKVQNCEDNSDEKNCDKIIFGKNYDKETPSRPENLTQDQDPLHYLKIKTKVKIMDIISASQNQGEMSLFLRLTFFWFDDKVKYLFLGDLVRKNTLNETLQRLVWNPVIDYIYLKNRRNVFRQMSIKKLKKPKLSGEINILQPLEIYEGSENPFRLEIYERVDILCGFDQIMDYPFGDDFCALDIFLDGNDNLLATFNPVSISINMIYNKTQCFRL